MDEDDFWEPDPADHWKDEEWKARDAIRRMNELLDLVFETVPQNMLLQFRSSCNSDCRFTDFRDRMDRQLERRFGIRPGEIPPDP